MKRPAAVLTLAAVLAFSACAGSRDHWVYGISRKAYPDLCDGNGSWFSLGDMSGPSNFCDPRQLLFIPVILALPFVLDTVFLPVTIPRDLYVYR